MANMSEPVSDKERYSWADYQADVVTLAERIRKDLVRQPAAIYGIPRGGLVIAVSLSHLLELPLVLSRDQIRPNTLVVDDIADSGATLDKLCKQAGFQMMIATLYYRSGSALRPDVFLRSKSKWIVFPWETDISSKYDQTTP
jgi:hypoxanthine phosphoribosyltransferase